MALAVRSDMTAVTQRRLDASTLRRRLTRVFSVAGALTLFLIPVFTFACLSGVGGWTAERYERLGRLFSSAHRRQGIKKAPGLTPDTTA
jgi:hypothetical protein